MVIKLGRQYLLTLQYFTSLSNYKHCNITVSAHSDKKSRLLVSSLSVSTSINKSVFNANQQIYLISASFTPLRMDTHCCEHHSSPCRDKNKRLFVSVPEVNWGEVVEIEAGTSHSEWAPGGRGPAPGRSAASPGEGLWGKGDMAAPLPLGSKSN